MVGVATWVARSQGGEMKSPPSTLTTAGKEVADAGALLKVFSGQLLVVPKTRDVCNGSLTDITARRDWGHVRFTSDSGHAERQHRRPLSAMCGRLLVGKSKLHVACWSVQPCVRPISAVRMTAGHNALRGSGPGQKPAFCDALAHVGCPDRRIDRLCITCCSPSQPSHHAGCSGAISYAASATGSL